MNKNVFIGIAVLLLLGGGYFYFSKSSGNPIYQKSAAGMIKGNIQDLFAKGTNMQCTFKYAEGENTSEGNIYVSGKKMRGSFSLKQADGTNYASNIIRDDSYGYTWVEGQAQGTKIKIETSEDIVNEAKENNNDKLFALDDKNINYDCKPWNVDNSLFTPPSNIQFQDISAQVEQIKKTTDQLKDTKCAACNNAPAGTAREQCLQALGCE